VLGPGWTVEEVPRPKDPLLTLDEQPALSGEHEERLLLILGVVEAVRLARLQDAELDADLRERELWAFETAIRTGRPLLGVLRRQPLDVPHVTTNQPSPAGARPEPESVSDASGMRRC
jgi:hypothetical protein